jgi:hypothetical protein
MGAVMIGEAVKDVVSLTLKASTMPIGVVEVALGVHLVVLAAMVLLLAMHLTPLSVILKVIATIVASMVTRLLSVTALASCVAIGIITSPRVLRTPIGLRRMWHKGRCMKPLITHRNLVRTIMTS